MKPIRSSSYTKVGLISYCITGKFKYILTAEQKFQYEIKGNLKNIVEWDPSSEFDFKTCLDVS
jgi:hypothetical protein